MAAPDKPELTETTKELMRIINRSFYPSRYAHLLPELKALIRSMGYRPGKKRCFQNCQALMLGACDTALEGRLEYHEGIAFCGAIPIPHAWLVLDGAIQDPTSTEVEHGPSARYSAEDIRANVTATGCWTALDEAQIRARIPMLFVRAIGP